MSKQHSIRPPKSNRSWNCKCGAINLGSTATCKMIRVEENHHQSTLLTQRLKDCCSVLPLTDICNSCGYSKYIHECKQSLEKEKERQRLIKKEKIGRERLEKLLGMRD